MDIRVGIDPGLTGALAIVGPGVTNVHDLPVVERSTGKGKELSAVLFDQLVDLLPTSAHFYLERVSAMPKQGVTSMFSLGRTLGVLEGVLASKECPYTLVAPQTWKRRAGLIGKPKDTARTVATKLYPHLAGRLARKKDIGRADALLIATFGC